MHRLERGRGRPSHAKTDMAVGFWQCGGRCGLACDARRLEEHGRRAPLQCSRRRIAVFAWPPLTHDQASDFLWRASCRKTAHTFPEARDAQHDRRPLPIKGNDEERGFANHVSEHWGANLSPAVVAPAWSHVSVAAGIGFSGGDERLRACRQGADIPAAETAAAEAHAFRGMDLKHVLAHRRFRQSRGARALF